MSGAGEFDEEGRLVPGASLWRRLPGPYGPDDVSGELFDLLANWDEGRAENFYLDRITHQVSTYPVTWAAFPWLWTSARSRRSALLLTSELVTNGYRLDCDCGAGPGFRFGSLPCDLARFEAECARAGGASDYWGHLRPEDGPALRRIEATCRALLPAVDAACIAVVADLADFGDIEMALVGPFALRGLFDVDLGLEAALLRRGAGRTPPYHGRQPDPTKVASLRALADDVSRHSEKAAELLRQAAARGAVG